MENEPTETLTPAQIERRKRLEGMLKADKGIKDVHAEVPEEKRKPVLKEVTAPVTSLAIQSVSKEEQGLTSPATAVTVPIEPTIALDKNFGAVASKDLTQTVPEEPAKVTPATPVAAPTVPVQGEPKPSMTAMVAESMGKPRPTRRKAIAAPVIPESFPPELKDATSKAITAIDNVLDIAGQLNAKKTVADIVIDASPLPEKTRAEVNATVAAKLGSAGSDTTKEVAPSSNLSFQAQDKAIALSRAEEVEKIIADSEKELAAVDQPKPTVIMESLHEGTCSCDCKCSTKDMEATLLKAVNNAAGADIMPMRILTRASKLTAIGETLSEIEAQWDSDKLLATINCKTIDEGGDGITKNAFALQSEIDELIGRLDERSARLLHIVNEKC